MHNRSLLAVVAAAAWTVSGNIIVLAWVVAAQLIYGTRFWRARKRRLKAAAGTASSDGKLSLQIGLVVTGLLWGTASVGCLFSQGMNWLSGSVLITNVALSVLVLGCYLGRRPFVLPFAVAAIAPIGVARLLLLEKAAVAVGIASLVFMAVISISAIQY